MAGNSNNLSKMWKLLGEKMDIEPPVPFHETIYLGCQQYDIELPKQIIAERSALITDVLSPSAHSTAVLATRGVTETSSKRHKAPNAGGDSTQKAARGDSMPETKAWIYNMEGHAKQCVQRYLEFSNKDVSSLKPVATPCTDDHQFAPEDFTTKGELAPVASRIVLKAFYLARMNRLDILWTINNLARKVTKWDVSCDKRLHRLISYMHHHGDLVQLNWVGDKPEDCKIALFVDASFAGEIEDSKSTTGAILVLIGPNTFVPLFWLCKKQGAVSHSSSEAEVIALEAALRTEGIPALNLWEEILEMFSKDKNVGSDSKPDLKAAPKDEDQIIQDILASVDYVPKTIPRSSGKAKILCLEDNEAVIKMTIKGRSPSMRHLSRTHRVDLDWLFERFRDDPGVSIKYINTKIQIADILTKGSFTAEMWNKLQGLSSIVKMNAFKIKTNKLQEATPCSVNPK